MAHTDGWCLLSVLVPPEETKAFVAALRANALPGNKATYAMEYVDADSLRDLFIINDASTAAQMRRLIDGGFLPADAVRKGERRREAHMLDQLKWHVLPKEDHPQPPSPEPE